MNEDIRAKIEKYKQLRTESNDLYNELNGVVESVITRYLALMTQDEAGQHAMNVSTAARYRHGMQIWAWSFTDDGIQVTYRHNAINEAERRQALLAQATQVNDKMREGSR